MKYPERKYPEVVFGFASDAWRWERLPEHGGGETHTEEGFLVFHDVEPERWGPSTQQYESTFGFSLLRPWALNFWIQFSPQKKDVFGNRIPGTEKVIYIRFALWRWDVAGTMDKEKKKLLHWIGPVSIYCNFSFHWD